MPFTEYDHHYVRLQRECLRLNRTCLDGTKILVMLNLMIIFSLEKDSYYIFAVAVAVAAAPMETEFLLLIGSAGELSDGQLTCNITNPHPSFS